VTEGPTEIGGPGEAGGPEQPGQPAPAHVPVMLDRVLELLAPAASRPGAVVVDATLGLGGHTEALLAAHPDLTVVGLDRDPEALALARARLAPYGDRVRTVHTVYDRIGEVLEEVLGDRRTPRVHGVLLDLGVSSLQLDAAQRGFAYAQDAPLDMRMDQSRGVTAADVLNTYPVPRLARVIRDYGEERFALRVAQAVGRERVTRPLDSTARLAEIVRDAIPAATRRTGGHPAKRTFQALRIEVNGELAALEAAVPAAVDALAVGGRIVVLSYQSLEDRLVKRALTARSRSTAPPDLPVVPDSAAPELRLLTRGAEAPDEGELARNPRSASARLRAAERVREAS
jgi:16S rRNA (cytosine1402-N4)-methyltransferase